MAFYALSVLPLIRSLKDEQWTQAWYADDDDCGGYLQGPPHLVSSFNAGWSGLRLLSPPACQTYLVVDSCDLQEAKQLFGPLGVNVTNSHRLLGGHLGSPEDRSRFVLEKAIE